MAESINYPSNGETNTPVLSEDQRRQKFYEALQIAKASENEAIKLAMLLMAYCPVDMAADWMPQFAEILNDENDHDALYTDAIYTFFTGKDGNQQVYYPVDADSTDGGSGSGNFGHTGRPGERGGLAGKASKRSNKTKTDNDDE